MKTKIIKCQLEDFEKLFEISRETFDNAFREKNNEDDFEEYMNKAFDLNNFKKEFDNPHSEFYFLWANDQLCGYSKLNEKSAQTESRGSKTLEIERIYLRNEYQSKGLGRHLINHAIEIAKSKGKTIIWLGVWEENKGAIRFYERVGFKVYGQHAFFMGNDEQIDLLMEKSL